MIVDEIAAGVDQGFASWSVRYLAVRAQGERPEKCLSPLQRGGPGDCAVLEGVMSPNYVTEVRGDPDGSGPQRAPRRAALRATAWRRLTPRAPALAGCAGRPGR